MLTLFSLLSVGISIVGVFGLILFETQFRRKEIGLRKVYGATIGEILRMFNKRYMRIVLACSVVAIPIGWYVVDRWLEKLRVPDTRKVVDFRRCGGKRRARHRADHYAAKLSDRY